MYLNIKHFSAVEVLLYTVTVRNILSRLTFLE